MPSFTFRVSRRDGTTLDGCVDGLDEGAVRSSLERQGLLVLEVRQQGRHGRPVPRWVHGRRTVTGQELLIFNRELLAMLKAGLPMLRIFDLLIGQAGSGEFHHVLVAVREDLRGGSAVSDAFARHPQCFAGLYVATVRAGEQAGNLPQVLARYIAYLTLISALRQKVMKALAYPAFLVIVGVAVVGFLLAYVMPTFVSVYGESAASLPAPTQALIDVIALVQDQALVLSVGSLAILVGAQVWYRTPAGRLTADRWLLRVPVLGDVLVQHNTVQLTHTLATVLAGGIPLVEALTCAGEALSNRYMIHGIARAVEEIRQGGTLGAALKAQGMLPVLAVEMLAIGEETGSLEPMLRDVAEFYEGHLDVRLTQLTTWIEPVLLLVMGVLVGTVVVIMYLPVFHMAGNIQ